MLVRSSTRTPASRLAGGACRRASAPVVIAPRPSDLDRLDVVAIEPVVALGDRIAAPLGLHVLDRAFLGGEGALMEPGGIVLGPAHHAAGPLDARLLIGLQR